MKKSSVRLTGSIAAGISGGAAFLIFFFLLQLHPLIAAATGAAVFAAVTLLLPSGGQNRPAEDIHGIMEKTLAQGRERLVEIRYYASKVKKPLVKSEIEILCLTFENFMKKYREDPQEFKVILSYYLDSTARIVKQYTELTEEQVRPVEVEETILKCESMFKTMNATLTRQLESKLEDDTIDLNAEISVLEKTLKTEGLK